MVITVDDYKNIRQMYLSGMSQRQIANELHISRNTVAKYCEGNAVPWNRKVPERETTILTDEVIKFIQDCLDEDKQENLKKQSHTAKRIYDRLVTEMNFTGGESTVRRKVKELKGSSPKVFIPLEFSPGEAMQVDWGEATVYLRDKKITVNLFCARLCSSCAPIVFAYRRQNEESFLEAFVRTFSFFGRVPEKAIFDNAKIAVKEGFGINAKKQAGYTALSAHYGFNALFCNPSEAHEKGLVEGLVGWMRRNILVPVPRIDCLEDLNNLLKQRCLEYLKHQIKDKPAPVGEMLETAKCSNVRVNAYSTVRFDTNDYSVPISYCGAYVSVKGYAENIEIYSEGQLIDKHERCFKRYKSTYKLEHYLPLLEQRGRAIFKVVPVRQNLPQEFLDWLQQNTSDHKELMQLLWECVDNGWKNVWESKQHVPQSSVINDIVTVAPINLSQYDCLTDRNVGA